MDGLLQQQQLQQTGDGQKYAMVHCTVCSYFVSVKCEKNNDDWKKPRKSFFSKISVLFFLEKHTSLNKKARSESQLKKC